MPQDVAINRGDKASSRACPAKHNAKTSPMEVGSACPASSTFGGRNPSLERFALKEKTSVRRLSRLPGGLPRPLCTQMPLSQAIAALEEPKHPTPKELVCSCWQGMIVPFMPWHTWGLQCGLSPEDVLLTTQSLQDLIFLNSRLACEISFHLYA